MSKLTWSYPKSADYDTCSLADGLLRHYLTPPPAPAPPKPTWWPSVEATAMLIRYWRADPQPLPGPFLLRLYAQLHRDRVAALRAPTWAGDVGWVTVSAGPGDTVCLDRRYLLALADDGNGA